MANSPVESHRIPAIYGVVATVLFTILSLASLVYDTMIDPITGRHGNFSYEIDSMVLMAYVLSALIAIIIGLLNTLSGQRLALQAYKIIVALLAGSALLAAIRLVYIAVQFAEQLPEPALAIQDQLSEVACVLVPAGIGVVAVFLRLRANKRKATVG